MLAALHTIMPFAKKVGGTLVKKGATALASSQKMQQFQQKRPLFGKLAGMGLKYLQGPTAPKEVEPEGEYADGEEIPVQDDYTPQEVHKAVRHIARTVAKSSGKDVTQTNGVLPRRHGFVKLDDAIKLHRNTQYSGFHQKYNEMRGAHKDRGDPPDYTEDEMPSVELSY